MITIDPQCYDGQDASARIQAAIDSLPAEGGKILLSGRVLLGAGGIVLKNRTAVDISGYGNNFGIRLIAPATRPTNSHGPAAILLDHCMNCTIGGLRIDANGQDGIPIAVKFSTGCSIAVNRIKNLGSAAAAIVGEGNHDNTYLVNWIIGPGGQTRGMWIGGTNAGEIEDAPVIEQNRISNMNATGLAIIATWATVRRNRIVGCQGAGIALAGGSSGAILNGNDCCENLWHGIQCDSTTPLVNIGIHDNDLLRNGISGLYIVRASGWNVGTNLCFRNGNPGNGIGIYVDRSESVTLTDNECNEQAIGIKVVAETVGQVIKSVRLDGNVCLKNSVFGVCATTVAGAGIDGLVIAGSDLRDNGTDDLFIVPAVGGPITGLQLTGNTAAKQRVPTG